MKAGTHDGLLVTLEDRFKKNMPRHAEIDWSSSRKRNWRPVQKNSQQSLKLEKPAVNRM